MNNRLKSLTTSFLSLLITVGIFGVTIYYLNSQRYINKQGSSIISYKKANLQWTEPFKNIEISQEIYSSQNNLAEIFLPVNTSSAPWIGLKLTSPDGQIIRQKILKINLSGETRHYLTWNFQPVSDSVNKKYLLKISLPNPVSQIKFYNVPKAWSDSGNLYIGNQLETNYNILVDWRYFEPRPFARLLKNITYFKPGVLNSETFYLITIILFWILNFFSLKAVFLAITKEK